MKTAKDIQDSFESYLQGLDYSRHPDNLYAPIRYVLSLGGKRIRPTLLLMVYNMYADDIEKVYVTAAGMEIFHNFTLLHDDLMDRADLRRGNQTVHKKWDENTAILSGDGMLVLAYRYLLESESPKAGRILDIATETFTGIMEGQQFDMEFESRDDVTEAEYIEMIRLKTSVLLAACARIGGELGGATAADAELLYDFGEKLGLAFQLQDDLLDVYGDPEVFGKKIGGDILCNKKTYLYINAYLLADKSQKASLDRWAEYDGKDEQAKIDGVRSIYDAVGVRRMSEKLIDDLFCQALEKLDKVSLPVERKQLLKEYAESLMNRVL
ncbi:MAG: polyprenyl synthetase family protein [Bacteroidaceae bacterium]|nr:polyprenyl synthetase family protein [Bacteroidaceae bacterium]